MQLELLNDQGQVASMVDVSDDVFGRPYNEALIHQLIVAYQANGRRGSRAQKDRAAVHHSTRKPFKQKGTGRARAGMTSSPLWRGGGKVFPNSPEENFSQKVNKKMYRAGMASILSRLVKDGRLSLIENFAIEAPKTKIVVSRLKEMGLRDSSVLLVTDVQDENIFLASRNLHKVLVVEPGRMSPVALVHYSKVLLTQPVVAQLEEMFA
jgi:large subunit ribosomal protein L4